jgi:hypothetical protein
MRSLERFYDANDEVEAKALLDCLNTVRNRIIEKGGLGVDDSVEIVWRDGGTWCEVAVRTPLASRLVQYDKAWQAFNAHKYV